MTAMLLCLPTATKRGKTFMALHQTDRNKETCGCWPEIFRNLAQALAKGGADVKMRGVEGLERFQAQLYSTQMGNPG
jgi:hypothetical protein